MKPAPQIEPVLVLGLPALHKCLISLPLHNSLFRLIVTLTLAYPKHLGSTYRAYSLNCWSPVLHGYGPGVLHFSFGSAFHTVCHQ